MDDRFHTEDVGFSGRPASPKPPQVSKSGYLGDFSENIDSTFGKSGSDMPKVNGTPKAKKFQVNLPEEANLIPDITPTQPRPTSPEPKVITGREYVEYIQNKPTESGSNVPNTVQGSPANYAPRTPVNRPSGATPSNTVRNRPVAAGTGNKPQPTAKRSGKPSDKKSPSGAKKASGRTKPAKSNSNQEQRKKQKAKRRYNFINSVLVVCVCVIFITILTVTASTVAMTTINDILVIDKGNNGGYVSVYIPPESDYDDVFDILKDSGLIKQPLITNIFCKFRHYHQVNKIDENGNIITVKIEYEAGTYYLDSDMGVESMLESMMSSRMNSSETVRLTFPEGWTIAQIFEKIKKYNVCEAEKLYANLDIIGGQYGFFEDITSVTGRYLKAEGYLFPDTYDFYIGENASSVIKKLFNNFETKWKEEYDERLDELGMTLDEVITVASIIQREAKDTTQMDDISSVIHNRLNDSATYPSIDMNSTKDYVLSLKEFNLFSDFYYNLYLNSYNTYSNGGLPPGPICNPGAAAIRAALYPSDTNYHFFCHDDSGEIYLAATASEHQANTEKVLYGH